MITFPHRLGSSERLDYSVDWSDVLEGSESIVDSEWECIPVTSKGGTFGIIGAPTVLEGHAIAFVGGAPVVGERYQIRNRITTDSTPVQRVYEESFFLVIVNQ